MHCTVYTHTLTSYHPLNHICTFVHIPYNFILNKTCTVYTHTCTVDEHSKPFMHTQNPPCSFRGCLFYWITQEAIGQHNYFVNKQPLVYSDCTDSAILSSSGIIIFTIELVFSRYAK